MRTKRLSQLVGGDRSCIHATALDNAGTHTADDQPTHPQLVGGDDERNDRAYRITDKVDLVGTEGVDQRRHVASHPALVEIAGIVWRGRALVTPRIDRDHSPAGIEQRLDDTGHNPIEVGVRSEAVMEDDRREGGVGSPVVVRDLETVVGREEVRVAHLASMTPDRRRQAGTRPRGSPVRDTLGVARAGRSGRRRGVEVPLGSEVSVTWPQDYCNNY